MRESIFILAQSTSASGSTGTVASSVATGVTGAGAAGATTGPDWWVIMSLIYLAVGVIGLAATLIGGAQWFEASHSRRISAGRHQVHGLMFSTLFILIGLFLQGLVQFIPPMKTFGPTMVMMLMGLIVIALAYLMTADRFEMATREETILRAGETATQPITSHRPAPAVSPPVAPAPTPSHAGGSTAAGSGSAEHVTHVAATPAPHAGNAHAAGSIRGTS